ncbi:alpha-L-fucosidase 2 [Arcticibacter tournemirensis]|uniref:Glycoside hydrolase family 95 protein n=1 Tax=Arcticibacter tournemirensis TaxID=699437 RepID=A0A5M9H3T8_9SPHI|nr:glycoside hydrolase family 95 protein [Arcticibacter tournemirensis]KAA8481583.1 glycoside hydrolase family 95 protein [Arcticibacter tournemirensis]TQM49029.1 alpha-L-fucosidase 2 [Arcticibacter tournemirensis]
MKSNSFVLQMFRLLLLFILPMSSFAQQKPDDLKIWFSRPAANWNEALPVGNGTLGAMVFGGIASERLQLNESSVWTGKPEDFVNPQSKAALPEVRKLLFEGKYAEAQKLAQSAMMGDKKTNSSYQTLGDLHIDFSLPEGEVSGYTRDLDLETAVSKVTYQVEDVTFTREVFSSFPANALIIRLTASKAASLSLALKLSRPGNKAKLEASGNELMMSEHVGDGTGVKMVTRVKVLNEGGSLQAAGTSIKVDKANTVVLLLTAATDYRGTNPSVVSANLISLSEGKSFETLKSDHIADYQKYFKRVELDLGTTDAVYFPTDSRITAVQNGNSDPSLIKLYYQFGRYLLISSSRPGGLPANLQGIWADGLTPPWSADYHININIQMNYWPSEITNLSEMHMPFLGFLNELKPDAKKTAKDMYGLKGTVAHFTTDPWHFTETYGQTQWAMWPMGMAWSVQHLWEHYLFTEDRKYLKELAYPLMKDAATFCEQWLVEDPHTGLLVSGPSISPENTFKTKSGAIATMVMGPTMDHMIIRDLLTNTIAAAKVLKRDYSFSRRLQGILKRLSPTKLGKDGRIMEWTEEFEEPEPGHRHISHLFGLYPGKQISYQQNPELLQAARKTLDYRISHGGGHTGWSRAWIINFFARLRDGEAAYQNLSALLQKSTLPNLFDNHPPFQIDGNFGAVAGITEMLMQSHAGEIELLPALPAVWQKGCIHGIVARGGFEINIDWQEGKLWYATITSRLGNPCTLRYDDKVITFPTEKEKSYSFNGSLQSAD